MVATLTRLYAVQTAIPWYDEFGSLELTRGYGAMHDSLPTDAVIYPGPALTSLDDAAPWWKIFTTLHELNPPLFYLLLRFWRMALGSSDAGMRLLPCIFSLTAIVLMYRAARDLHGPAVALWACAFMAISGQQILFAPELRTYSLATVATLGACGAMIAVEKRGSSTGRLVVLGAWTFVLVLTHYFAAGAVAALALYAIIRLPRSAMWRVLATFAAASALFGVTWGPLLIVQIKAFVADSAGTNWLAESGPNHLTLTLVRLMRVPLAALGPFNGPRPVVWVAAAAWLLPLFWVRRRPDLLLWFLLTGCICSMLAALDLFKGTKNLEYERYFLIASPGVYAVFASAWSHWKGWWHQAFPAVVALSCAAMLSTTFRQLQELRFDWQVVGSIVAESIGPGEPILIAAPGEGRPIYLCFQHYVPVASHPVIILTRPVDPSWANQRWAAGEVWVICDMKGAMNLPTLLRGAAVRTVAIVQNTIVVARATWPHPPPK